MFGSKKTAKVANEFKAMAQDSQSEMDSIKSANPFESAASKSAMAKASQNAQQFYNRGINAMGANASPEAIISAQGVASDAVGAAAGEVAVGSEANQQNQLNALNSLKNQQMNAYASTKVGGIKNTWDNMFKSIDAVGKVASAGGQAGGDAANIAALASDRRLKENIKVIGELQGHKIYKFNYIGMTEVHIGVMAQDIEHDHPDCIVPTSGYMFVNYDKLFKEEK